MARVMSPKAPERETRGFQMALAYYAKRPLLSRAEILQSAELLRQHFAESQGYEFANGFVDGATVAAQGRHDVINTKRICENCAYWKKDWGIFTATGWTGAGRNEGDCHYEPRTVSKRDDDCCHNWTPKVATDA